MYVVIHLRVFPKLYITVPQKKVGKKKQSVADPWKGKFTNYSVLYHQNISARNEKIECGSRYSRNISFVKSVQTCSEAL